MNKKHHYEIINSYTPVGLYFTFELNLRFNECVEITFTDKKKPRRMRRVKIVNEQRVSQSVSAVNNLSLNTANA